MDFANLLPCKLRWGLAEIESTPGVENFACCHLVMEVRENTECPTLYQLQTQDRVVLVLFLTPLGGIAGKKNGVAWQRIGTSNPTHPSRVSHPLVYED